MLRLFTRVTLGAVGKEEGDDNTTAGANFADKDNQEIPNESNPDEFALHHFHQHDNDEAAAIIVNDIHLAPELHQPKDDSSEETESEIEEVSADLRENLLVNRRHKRNNYTVSFLLFSSLFKVFFVVKNVFPSF